MKFLRSALAVSTLFLLDKFFSHFLSVVVAQQFPFEKPFLNLATGTITNTIFEKFLGLGINDRPKCALSLSNNLTRYRLIDPFVYLEHGEHPMPVPVKVESGSTIETLFEAADVKKDTSGLLFYSIEKTGHFLVIFWKVSGPQPLSLYSENRFYVDILNANKVTKKEETLKRLYLQRKQFSEKSENPLVQTIPVDVLGTKLSERPKITYRAQMTTEKDGKLTIVLTESAAVSQLHKRVALSTTIGVALATKVLNVVFKKLMKKIPSEQTGTIEIENLSKDTSLINPNWVMFAGYTTSIVPWYINPSEKGKITWRSPLGGTQVTDTFKPTIHFLSYQIAGTNYHVVFGSTFPLKGTKGKTTYTIFVREVPEYAKIEDDLLIMAKALEQVDIHGLGSYLASKKLTLGSPHIVGIDSTKFERYHEWQFPIFTPQVKLKRNEYHVRIVAAVGFGKAMGVTARVEVQPGASPKAASFKTQNPQIYKEPVAAVATVSGIGTSGSRITSQNMADKAIPTNQITANSVPFNGSPLAGSTVPEANVKNTPVKLVPEAKLVNTPAKTASENNVANTPVKSVPKTKMVNTLAKPIPAVNVKNTPVKLVPGTKVINTPVKSVPETSAVNTLVKSVTETKMVNTLAKTVPAANVKNIPVKLVPEAKVINTPVKSVPETNAVNTLAKSVPETKMVNTPAKSVPETKMVNTPAKSVPETKMVNTPVKLVTTSPESNVVYTPATTVPESNVLYTPATTVPESNAVNTPAILPNGMSTNENLFTDANALGIDYPLRRSGTKRSGTSKKFLANLKRAFRRNSSKKILTNLKRALRRNPPSRSKTAYQ